MSFIMSKRAALALALIALCNNTMSRGNLGAARAQMLDGQAEELGLIGSRQVSFEPAGEFATDSQGHLGGRFRRQISIPEGSPMQQAPPPPPAQNPLGFFSQLGPQLSQGAQLFGSQPAGQSGSNNNNQMASMLMGQLSEMIRSTQNSQKQVMDATQRNVQSATQASQQAAQNAQGGIQGALADIGAGLQRIAANNPNLLPDVKNLYQTVSTKLTSASSSVAQAASPTPSGQQQFADGLAKQIANPQPLPSPST